jgi:hypothetical protein
MTLFRNRVAEKFRGGHLGWILIQYNLWAYKKGKPGHRFTKRENHINMKIIIITRFRSPWF